MAHSIRAVVSALLIYSEHDLVSECSGLFCGAYVNTFGPFVATYPERVVSGSIMSGGSFISDQIRTGVAFGLMSYDLRIYCEFGRKFFGKLVIADDVESKG